MTWFQVIAALGGPIAAIIAFFAGLLLASLQVRATRQRDARLRSNELSALSLALCAEVDSNRKRMGMISNALLQAVTEEGDGIDYDIEFSILLRSKMHDTVYRETLTNLGRLPPEIAGRLAAFYDTVAILNEALPFVMEADIPQTTRRMKSVELVGLLTGANDILGPTLTEWLPEYSKNPEEWRAPA